MLSKKTAQKFCTNDTLKKRNQRTTEVKSLSESCRTEMLPKTPLKIVIVRKVYQNARQKVSITKTVQKTAKFSLSEENRTEFFIKSYHAKVPSKTRAKVSFREKTVLKNSS